MDLNKTGKTNNQSPLMNIKNFVKKVLGPERYFSLYKNYYRIVSAYFIVTHSVGKVLFQQLLGSNTKPRQKYLVWRTQFPQLFDFTQLISFLQNNHILFFEGGCTIYIPPQPNINKYFGEMVDFYPPDAGYKILKDFTDPSQANYVKYVNTVSWPEEKLGSNVTNSLEVACTLEVLKLGPRVYDLVELRAGESIMTCFVVKHIKSQTIEYEDAETFLKRIDSDDIKSIVGTIVPYKTHPHSDFIPPSLNNNLLKNENSDLLYIDFQQFAILDPARLPYQIISSDSGKLSFGDINFLRDKKPYIYQTIPGIPIAGKRDTLSRWQKIIKMLEGAGINFDKRLVLDICCNSGIMSSMALSEGALWALGWDIPQVTDVTMELQRSLGFSRIDLIGAFLSKDYSLLADIDNRLKPYLSESIIFYFSAIKHIGLLTELAIIPWRVLLFEGHESRNQQNYSSEISFFENECHSRLSGEIVLADGDSQKRCLLLFIR